MTAATSVENCGLDSAIWTMVFDELAAAAGALVVVLEAELELHAAMTRPAVASDRTSTVFRNFTGILLPVDVRWVAPSFGADARFG